MTDAATLEENPLAASSQPPPKTAKRKRLFLIFGGGLILIAACWWIWQTFIAADAESKENAYTNVAVSQATPWVGDPVKRVLFGNSQIGHAGDLPLELVDTDLQLAVAKDEGEPGRSRRHAGQGPE